MGRSIRTRLFVRQGLGWPFRPPTAHARYVGAKPRGAHGTSESSTAALHTHPPAEVFCDRSVVARNTWLSSRVTMALAAPHWRGFTRPRKAWTCQ
jgi:hypothetical protein